MKFKLITITLLSVLLSNCYEKGPQNKPTHQIGDIVHLKLNPEESFIIVDIEDNMLYMHKKDSMFRYDYVVKNNRGNKQILKQAEILE